MLKALQHIVQSVSDAENFQSALNILVTQVRASIRTEACTVYLFDGIKKEYILLATDGLNPNAVEHIRVAQNEGLVGLVGRKGEPINLKDATRHPNFLRRPEVGEEKYRAFLGVPIIHQRELLGVMTVQQSAQRRFDEVEEAFLITLSAQLAGVLAHAKATGLLNLSNQQSYTVQGLACVDGIAIGKSFIVYPLANLDTVPDRTIKPEQIDEEIANLQQAFNEVKEEIKHLCVHLSQLISQEELALFNVYLQILDQTNLLQEIMDEIKKQRWAQTALRHVINKHIEKLNEIENEYLSERSSDIHDLGIRILAKLQKQNQNFNQSTDQPIIVVAERISATTLAELAKYKIVGIASNQGSYHSHTAILARALGIPTVLGVPDLHVYDLHDKNMILDGYYGYVHINPNQELRDHYREVLKSYLQLEKELVELQNEPAVTTDGEIVKLNINAGLPIDESHLFDRLDHEDIGLYRTEIPFMNREYFPTEEEQYLFYRQILHSFSSKRVVMRTLDIGGDKKLPYFQVQEDNPFLGWRGIRIMLDHPEIFLAQIRALLRANEFTKNLNILIPMISRVEEVDEALTLIYRAHQELTEENKAVFFPPIGVMIEVPSAVYQVKEIAKRVDFISVGSNDLTQYLLAVDRNNTRVANLFDSYHPAVIKALYQIVVDAHEVKKPVSICGELAADPLATILLLGMGFDSLSMNANRILKIKKIIRSFSMIQAKEILAKVLIMEDSKSIRQLLIQLLKEVGLEK